MEDNAKYTVAKMRKFSTELDDANEKKLWLHTVVPTVHRYLTHSPKISYADYIFAMFDEPYAIIPKICDLTHNMSDLDPGSKKDKYQLAYKILTMNVN